MIVKQFNDFGIEIREDGYFNATSMCKPFGKKVADYLRLDSTKAFLEELSNEMGLTISELVQVRKGGDCSNQGTWFHRLVAIDQARWLNPKFHVTVIIWTSELLSGNNPLNNRGSFEEAYVDRFIDLFSRTSQPLRKEVIVPNTAGDNPKTRRFDMKEVNSNIYYEVKMHPIGMSDLKEIFFNRKYPEILEKLHSDYTLYFVSPEGITDEARCFINLMTNVYFILGHELALRGVNLIMQESPYASDQIQRHILPRYQDILPQNWQEALNPSNQIDVLALSGKDTSYIDVIAELPQEMLDSVLQGTLTEGNPPLIYNGALPVGVSKVNKPNLTKPYQAKFTYNGTNYTVGRFKTPLEAGEALRDKMIQVKGFYGFANTRPRLANITN
jgi:hypothetical protein